MAALARDQVASDRLPDALSDLDFNVDPATVRRLDVVDGVEYFAGRSVDGNEYCFAILGPDSAAAAACGKTLPIGLTVGELPEAQLTALPRQPDSTEWTSPAENLAIRSAD